MMPDYGAGAMAVKVAAVIKADHLNTSPGQY
jgi:hypothetical protein